MQEVGSYRPAVRPERRRAMQQEIVASAPHALQVLASCLNHKGEQQSGACCMSTRTLITLETHDIADTLQQHREHYTTHAQSSDKTS